MKENKLIAEFWGMVLGEDGTMYYDDAENFFTPTPTNKLKFHESWDWLMPVVEKIEDIENKEISTNLIKYHLYDVEIRQNVTTIHGTNIEETAGDKLFNTYHAVVEFIKQHNK